jgi:DNA-binding NarL/FixJ family response regulator
LQLQAGMVVVAETDDAGEVFALLARTPCNVLLLDRGLQSNGRIDIREVSETVNVLMICSDTDDPSDAVNAVRTGARGILFKRCTIMELTQAIRAVATGQVWMPLSLQARVVDTLHEDLRVPLTRREREIVRQVALGLRNGEISKALFISEQTVKTHLSHIFRKIGVRDRAALTLYASRLGLVGQRDRRS